ncbi:MAG: ATP-binding cassette domain-containing protein [Firmicutes bacterium]|nr:ATP-binding cassette domain-containing protein [Bacillota bacterium]
MDNTKGVIVVENLTKDYGNNQGIFDVSFRVNKGEVFGFLGPNGAGKTTTIRHLLGFIKSENGSCKILGLDCWEKPEEIQNYIGYVAGEIALPDSMNGQKLIEHVAKLRKIKLDRAKELCAYFDINPKNKIKRMSKGMKQKIALVLALMHDPEILILDEPTSGLDPLMQEKFCELLLREKERGKTIMLSSHIFNEVEKTCDRVMIIKQGRIITEVDMKDIDKKRPEFVVTKFSLEQYFMDFYKKEKQ